MPAPEESGNLRLRIRHPRLVELLDYWLKLKGSRKIPLRAELDPAAIPKLLPNILINEVERDPLRFRIRLEGQGISAARGFNAMGRYVDEPGVVILEDDILGAYARMICDGEPWFSEGDFSYAHGRGGRLYRLALPFSHLGTEVDFIVVGFYHELSAARSGAQPALKSLNGSDLSYG